MSTRNYSNLKEKNNTGKWWGCKGNISRTTGCFNNVDLVISYCMLALFQPITLVRKAILVACLYSPVNTGIFTNNHYAPLTDHWLRYHFYSPAAADDKGIDVFDVFDKACHQSTRLKSWSCPPKITWLVVGPPLWKIWTSIGMMTFPIYGKIKHGNQTTNL